GRLADLGKNSKARDLERTGSRRTFFPSRGGNVDQRPDRLCVLVAGPDRFSMASTKIERCCHRMVRLVAMGGVVRDISRLGHGRDWVRAGILRARCPARVRRTIQRRGASFSTALFLFPASPPSIRAVESSFDFVAGAGAAGASDKNSRCVARDVAGNILALRLESRRVAGDVVDSVKTGRSDFSRRAAALFIAGGA